MLSPVVSVIWVKPDPAVQRKISQLPSRLLFWTRSRLERKAIRVPSAEMEGLALPSPMVVVSWVCVNWASEITGFHQATNVMAAIATTYRHHIFIPMSLNVYHFSPIALRIAPSV